MKIERVHKSKLLGIIINGGLGWDAHVHQIKSKLNKRIHYFRDGLLQSDLINFS